MEKYLLQKKPVTACHVLVIGVTYKRDINDLRESPALRVVDGLIQLGIKLSYYDPYIDEIEIGGNRMKSSILIEGAPDHIKQHDCTLILTNHSSIPYQIIVKHSPLVIDTWNNTVHIKHQENVTLI